MIRLISLTALAAVLVAWWATRRPKRREIPAAWREDEDGVQVDPRPASLLHPTFAGGQDGYDRWIADWEAWAAACPEHDHAAELVQARQLAQRGYRLALPHDDQERFDRGLVRLLEDVRLGETSVPVG